MSRSRLSFPSYINPVIESLESRRLRSADLSAAFSSAIPDQLSVADNNHVAIHVIDDGDAAASGKVNVGLYLSPVTGAEDDILLASTTKSMDLKPGQGRNVGLRFAEPSAAPDGSYVLFADVNSSAIANVDGPDDIVTASSPVLVDQPKADLTALSVKAPGEPIVVNDAGTVGEPARVTIANRGNASADGDVTIEFYLSQDGRLDSGDILAATIDSTRIALKPGQREQFTAVLDPDAQTPAGSYFLLADVMSGRGIVQRGAAGEVGVAARQVLVVRETSIVPPESQDDTSIDDSQTVVDSGGIDGSLGQESGTPSTAPTQPAPTGNGPATQPTTQPTTQPCDGSGTDSTTPGCDSGSTDQTDQSDQSTPPDDSSGSDNSSSDGGDSTPSSSDDSQSNDNGDSSNDSNPSDDSGNNGDSSNNSSQNDSSSGDSSDSGDDSGDYSGDNYSGDDSGD